MTRLDLTGQKFGTLIALYRIGYAEKHQAIWQCRCDCKRDGCPKYVQVLQLNLRHKRTKGCGCLGGKVRHGASSGGKITPEYRSYRGAKERCQNKKHHKYLIYGGRGIEFRFNNFEEFYNELGPKPEPKSKYSVDRKKNNGHYERGNVRWATAKEQANNRRNSRCQ